MTKTVWQGCNFWFWG